MRRVLALAGIAALALAALLVRQRSPAEQNAAMPDPGSKAAPEFPQGTQWLQSKPLTLAALRGQVVILHFWTFGCINCVHNYPVYKAWQEKYAGKGAMLIGVHTPELPEEADVARLRVKIRDAGLKFPVAVDRNREIWNAWGNEYWPSIYLIDKRGRVRYHWDGELHLDHPEDAHFAARIDELLREAK